MKPVDFYCRFKKNSYEIIFVFQMQRDIIMRSEKEVIFFVNFDLKRTAIKHILHFDQ